MKGGEGTGTLLGFGLGAGLGLLANGLAGGSAWLDWAVGNLTEPAGQLFLRLLLMVVVPLVFATLVTGLATLGGLGAAGRLGLRTVGWYLGLAAAGAVIGAGLTAVVNPGNRAPGALRVALAERVTADSSVAAPVALTGDALARLIPVNPVAAAVNGEMLPFLVFTLLFGAAVASVPVSRASPILRFLDAVAQVSASMVRFAMSVAPVGVGCLAFTGFARFGLDLVGPLALFVLVVVVPLGGCLLGLFPVLLRLGAGRAAAPFFAASRPALITAFATASSNATLPTTLRVATEGLGVPTPIAGFVVSFGASVSRAGTAIFTAATAVFLAQALGIEVTVVQGATVVALATVTAIAAGGVPSGVIPLLATVVAGAGVPAGAIGLVLGVEPILGMARTAVNVSGALVAAVVLARGADLTSRRT